MDDFPFETWRLSKYWPAVSGVNWAMAVLAFCSDALVSVLPAGTEAKVHW